MATRPPPTFPHPAAETPETPEPSRRRGTDDAASDGPIDFDYLDSQTLGDAPLQRELLGLLAGQIRRFAGRVVAGDDEEVRQIAHALKGAASAVGAAALSDMAARCELRPSSRQRRRDLQTEMAVLSAFIAARDA